MKMKKTMKMMIGLAAMLCAGMATQAAFGITGAQAVQARLDSLYPGQGWTVSNVRDNMSLITDQTGHSIITHPVGGSKAECTPTVLSRTLKITGANPVLKVTLSPRTASGYTFNWGFTAKVNGKQVDAYDVTSSSAITREISLKSYIGQTVTVQLLGGAYGDWNNEYAYWDSISIYDKSLTCADACQAQLNAIYPGQGWTVSSLLENDGLAQEFDAMVLTHPVGSKTANTPAKLSRTLTVTGENPRLHLKLRSRNNADGSVTYDWMFSAKVNGTQVDSAQIRSATAVDRYISLKDYVGQTVTLELFGGAGGEQSDWNNEHAYWDLIEIVDFPDSAPADATGDPIGVIGDVMTIDVSGGSSASVHPVSLYANVDIGKFNCSVYKTTKIALRKVPAGMILPVGDATTFNAGNGWSERLVKVNRDYWIGLFMITMKQYEQVTGTRLFSSGDGNPAHHVSYNMIRSNQNTSNVRSSAAVTSGSFMGLLSSKAVSGCDLPTELQWEAAARAGKWGEYGSGLKNGQEEKVTSANLGEFARYGTGGSIADVGTKLPNVWGIYDVCGLGWELCRDEWNGGATSWNNNADVAFCYAGASATETRVVRSGCYNSNLSDSRLSCRGTTTSSNAGNYNVGEFRLCVNGNAPSSFAVLLDARGGTGGAAYVMAQNGAAMPTAAMPEKEGFGFLGYYDAPNGGTQYYHADGTSAREWSGTVSGVLYAHWSEVVRPTTTAKWTELLAGSTSGTTLTSGFYVIPKNLTFSNGTAGGSGLTIADGAEVYLYIPADVTLTCAGKDGSGQTGGGAGILLPSTAKLYLLGNGTVVAKGGKGGNGGNGGNAVNSISREGNSDSTIRNTDKSDFPVGTKLQYAKGGAGGAGGGGAGAGIGTSGGKGGAGVAMGDTGWGWTLSSSSDCSLTHYGSNSGINGTNGKQGANSVPAAEMGKLHIAATLTVNATGGAAGQGGKGGSKSGYRWSGQIAMVEHEGDGTLRTKSWPGGDSGNNYNNSAAAGAGRGGGGGGGGGGYAGANIGNGGASGAGGGAGGNGGAAILCHQILWGADEDGKCSLTNGGGGKGGAGGNDGVDGAGTQSSCYGVIGTMVDNKATRYDTTTYHGGASGASGAAGATGEECDDYDQAGFKAFAVQYLKADGSEYDTDTYNVNGLTVIDLPDYSGYQWMNTVYGKVCGSPSDLSFASDDLLTGTINARNVYGDLSFRAVPNVYHAVIAVEGGEDLEFSITYGEIPAAIAKPAARAGYVFVGYFTEPDGKGVQVFGAEGQPTGPWMIAEDATLYPQWAAAEIPVEGDVKVKVDDEWIKKNNLEGKTEEKIKEKLNETDADGTGLKKWQNWALGVEDSNTNAKPVIKSATKGATGKVALGVPNYTVNEKSGVSVTRKLVKKVGANETETDLALDATAVEVDEGDVSAATPVALYKTVVTFTDASGKQVSEERNAVGVMYVRTPAQKAMVAVPWEQIGGGAISAADLIDTRDLANGDKLHVYDKANGRYKTWTLKDGAWSPLGTYKIEAGKVSESSAGAPDGMTIARGDGVWLERGNTEKPFHLIGQYNAEKVTLPSAAGWNICGNAGIEKAAVADLGAGDGDIIIVPTEAEPVRYTKKDGAWGYYKETVTEVKGRKVKTSVWTTEDCEIGVGQGFWLVK